MGLFEDYEASLGNTETGAKASLWDDYQSKQPKPTQNVLTDTAQDVIQGTLRIPGAITGLADIPAGLMGFNRPFDRATDYIGEKTGIQPGKLADSIQANNYSPERVAANQRLDQTWQDYQSDKIGLGEALADTVANPRALLGNVVGSVPSMYAGGMLGNAARAAGLVSKAAVPFVGEGAVMAGQAMDSIDASVDPQKAAILSAATGLSGGLLARGGGKLSEKMGLVDPDVAIANGLSQTATKAPMSLGARTAGGFLAEGAMEELPQSLMEQGLQNYAEDKPLTEGMARAGVEGLLSGGLMGAGFNALPQSTPKIVEKPISDGPLGNAAAAGGITQTEITDAGNEAEPAIATQQAPSPVDFQPTHLADDGTPVAYREDDQGPYFETADGQQWDYTDTATPITQEAINANNPDGNAVTDNSQTTGENRGTGSDQRGFDTSLEPTDGRADDRGINGVDGQLRGAESPSDVESGGTLSPSSIVNTQYLTDNGVTESDISRIDQALNNNPGLAQKPLGFIRGFLKDKYQGLDYSQVIQDVSTQQSPASSLDATTTQSQPDAGLVSGQPGNLNAQTPETQPVLPNTGANQTGNASTVGAGQGQSAVSGQEEVAPPSYQSAVDAQFKQKSYDAPTKALGGMTPREYGKQHVEAGHQFVEKDGKYYLKGDGAGMKQIPKATYLYGSALEKASRESGDYVASKTTQSAPQAIEPKAEQKQPWTDIKQDTTRWHGSRVEIAPQMKGDTTKQGTVKTIVKGSVSSIIEVNVDGFEGTFRYRPEQLKVLSIVDNESTGGVDRGSTGEVKKELKKPSTGYVNANAKNGSLGEQINLAARAQRLVTLTMMNDVVNEYSRSEIENISDDKIDEVGEYLRQKYNAVKQQSSNSQANQAGNAAPMGVGQGQSAVSGQEALVFNSNKGKHPAAETELPKQVLGGAIPKGWENLNTLRGRVVTAKTHDGEVFTDGKTIIPALPSVKNPVSGVKSATVTQGDKFNSVRAIDQQLQRSLPNMDNDVDEYWEPYSASLTFALNLSHLQNTNKPVNLNVSSVYEPVKSPVYKGLKGNPVVQLKTGEQMNYRDAYVRGIETMDDVGHEEIDRFVAEIGRNRKKAPLRFESAKDSAKNVVALLSRDNVVLHDSEDNDFIEKARQSAMSGKRLAFIDDSNYALMQNESPSDVYDGSVSSNQQSLFDSVAKGQKFEPRNTNYLLAQKQAAYDAISKNGVIVATNHYTQPLVDFLRRYNPQMYGFKQYSQWTKDSEYGYLNAYRPEYLAIIGAQGESNVRDYQNPRQLLVAKDRSDAEKVSASGNGSGVTAGSGLSRRSTRGNPTSGGRESTGNSLPNSEAGRSSVDSGNSTGRESTGAGRGIKLSNKPTLTALFNQLGKLKAAEKANKDVKALIDAHPKAELIRHVQNHWTDVLVQHEKNSDNPNGKVTIQC